MKLKNVLLILNHGATMVDGDMAEKGDLQILNHGATMVDGDMAGKGDLLLPGEVMDMATMDKN